MTITKEELSRLCDANRRLMHGTRVSDNVEVWAYNKPETINVLLDRPCMTLDQLDLDDVYNIIVGRTDLALALALMSLCGDAVVAVRFATP